MRLSITSAARVLANGTANRCVDREGGRGNAVAVAQAARLSRAQRSICVCISQQRRLRSAWGLSIAGTAGELAVSAADHEEVCGEGCAIAVAWAARLGDCWGISGMLSGSTSGATSGGLVSNQVEKGPSP